MATARFLCLIFLTIKSRIDRRRSSVLGEGQDGENLLAQLIAKGSTRGLNRAPIHDNGFARRSDLDICQP